MDVDFVKYKFVNEHDGVATRQEIRPGIRHIQILYMFACGFFLGVVRGGNTIGVMGMVDPHHGNDTLQETEGWAKRHGSITSSFCWGFALCTLPAELYLRRASGKAVLTAAILANGVICVLLPLMKRVGGWAAVFNSMVILGGTQTLLSPANQGLLDKWLPPYERNIFSPYIYAGVQLGMISSYPIAEALVLTKRLKWEMVYYTFAMMMISASAMWGMLTSATPGSHPAVGNKEKEYIQKSVLCYKKSNLNIPWRLIMSCPPVWASMLGSISCGVTFTFFLIEAPVYLKHALKIPDREYGWLAMLPFLVSWIVFMTVSPTIEWVCKAWSVNLIFRITDFRKIIYCFGAISMIVGYLSLSAFGPEHHILAVMVLTSIMAFSMLQLIAYLENIKDMSQNFTSCLLAICCTGGSAFGAMVPLLTGLLLDRDVSDLSAWRIVFISIAILTLVCNILFVIFSSSERQLWDYVEDNAKYEYSTGLNFVELNTMQRKEESEENKLLFSN